MFFIEIVFYKCVIFFYFFVLRLIVYIVIENVSFVFCMCIGNVIIVI